MPTGPPPAVASPRPPPSSQPYGCSRSTATCAASTLNHRRTPAAAADRPRRGSWSTLCRAPQKRQKQQKLAPELFLWLVSFLRRTAGVPNEGPSAPRTQVRQDGHSRSSSIWAVTLSNENGPSRSRPCPDPPPALSGRHAPTMADRRGAASLWSGPCEGSWLAEHRALEGASPRRSRGRDRRWARTMASVGIRKRVSARTGRVTYQVWWLLDDGSQGAETVRRKDEARHLVAQKRLGVYPGCLAGAPARPASLQLVGRAVVGGVGGRSGPQSHHPGGDREPPSTVRTAMVRRAADQADRPADIRRWQAHLEQVLDQAKRRASPRGGRSAARPVPAVLVGPRAVPARHRAAVRGAGRAAPPPRPPEPRPPCPPGRRHPLSGRPVGQRLQAAAQEGRRHPRDPSGPTGGRGYPPPPAATGHGTIGPGVHR